ncbi:MAG: hypothetical protein AAGC93_05545 [Cyanobacteria bacterium P01_F01_bin.53]
MSKRTVKKKGWETADTSFAQSFNQSFSRLGAQMLGARMLGTRMLGVVLGVGLCTVPQLALSPAATAGGEAMVFTGATVESQGTTVGQYQLTQLAARDRHRKLCLGYGARQPDHTLELSEEQARLRVAVNSDGGDTTLLIQGPWGIDCNDNRGRNQRDAAITDVNWPAGTYLIWVGGYNRGDRIDYQLSVAEPPATRRR